MANTTILTAQALGTPGKGILAADESAATLGKHFDDIGVESTEETRRAYRELLFTAPGIQRYISGVILFDETIRESTHSGKSFVDVLHDAGVIVGIKVDEGLIPFQNSPIEKITRGIDGLPDRLHEYYRLGARFAKWRAVFTISDTLPSAACVDANADLLARYALACQAEGIVPIVEPEVLMDGAHTMERCYAVTVQVHRAVFKALKEHRVDLSAVLLKPNMILPGEQTRSPVDANKVADLTLRCLHEAVPSVVPGIVFLSGGQSEAEACETLQAISRHAHGAPWFLTYSYGRALQTSTLRAWGGEERNVAAAQKAFLEQAHRVSLAQQGRYTKSP